MTIEFVEDTHTYLINGVIAPSVTDLVKFKFPDAYKGVPTKVLKRKASYGTDIHDLIQQFVAKKITLDDIADDNNRRAVKEFEFLRKKWAFHVKDMEQIVAYKDKYAGRYDILTIDDYILDIKTTSTIHEDWVSLQLSLYYLACGIEQPYGYVIWLPKNQIGEVKQIPVMNHEDTRKFVQEYEEHSSED